MGIHRRVNPLRSNDLGTLKTCRAICFGTAKYGEGPSLRERGHSCPQQRTSEKPIPANTTTTDRRANGSPLDGVRCCGQKCPRSGALRVSLRGRSDPCEIVKGE